MFGKLVTVRLVIIAAALAGCQGRGQVWNQSLAILGPYQMGSQVVWLDVTRGLAIALEPAGTEPLVRTVPMRRNATYATVAPDGQMLLVLTAGQETLLKNQRREEPGLSLFSVLPGRPPELVHFYPLSSAFDRLAVSPDGKLAIAYCTASELAGGVFRNPNEIALVELSRESAVDNPRLHTVRSSGSAPLGVVFSPAMAVPAPSGPQRTLALALAKNAITFLDLSHPERREITVPLTKPDSSEQFSPEQVEFSPATGTVLVRASGAADLYSLSLQAELAAEATDNDYRPSVNQSGSGKVPLDMLLFSDQGRDLILTANASQDLAVIDVATSQFTVIPVSSPIDSLLAVPAASPKLAVAYSASNPSEDVYFIELKGLAEGLDKNLTHRKLERPVRQLVATPAGDQALVVHDDKRTVVSMLDLQGQYHTVSPIQGQLPLESFDFVQSEQGSFLAGVSSGLQQLGLLDLGSLHAVTLRLDLEPRRVMSIGSALVIDHGDPLGTVTVVPKPHASREESRTLWGIFADGLIERALLD